MVMFIKPIIYVCKITQEKLITLGSQLWILPPPKKRRKKKKKDFTIPNNVLMSDLDEWEFVDVLFCGSNEHVQCMSGN